MSNTECKHNVHYDQKVHMSLNYGTSIILFALKNFSITTWSIIVISQSQISHSGDNARKNVSGYWLPLTIFVLSENCDAWFYSYWL